MDNMKETERRKIVGFIKNQLMPSLGSIPFVFSEYMSEIEKSM